jgi:hypothetical protein
LGLVGLKQKVLVQLLSMRSAQRLTLAFILDVDPVVDLDVDLVFNPVFNPGLDPVFNPGLDPVFNPGLDPIFSPVFELIGALAGYWVDLAF